MGDEKGADCAISGEWSVLMREGAWQPGGVLEHRGAWSRQQGNSAPGSMG